MAFRRFFHFNSVPLSREEAEFPLAYGIVAYKSPIQFLYMLSAFYHPQNVYCIAVGANSKLDFQNLVEDVSKCYPNVYLMKRPEIRWGSFEIINSVYECLEFLATLKVPWKYFQYLSGFDAPLKTNLEMVRIFKALRGSPNFEFKKYEAKRAKTQNLSKFPLKLFKSSLSALIPRESANDMTKSEMVHRLLKFLEGTEIADESFWATVLANKDVFPIFGAINGSELMETLDKFQSTTSLVFRNYYISRRQIWEGDPCHGHFKSGSCVFGIGDLPSLLNSKELVGHKFYVEDSPTAFVCVLKEIQQRSMRPADFNTTFYENLPQIELVQGVPAANLTNLKWFL
ncbi:unnamed protein product [Caenorhabditis bovis]|uniref:Uncharacterized protein n=1 Tax=Caenorhabditis bovis TaxID=2654633 RepID=A0A8S1F165_9PELO|nr:unnamed protein product [Caenorhabditis bovis]